MPRVSGADTGTKRSSTPGAPAAASVSRISGVCWWSRTLYGFRFTARTGWCVPAVGAMPLPDDPVIPTTCTAAPASLPARASGNSASSIVVAKQPGDATARAARIASRFSSGRP